MELSDLLINWYLNNKRTLPWRETNDPYKIWISEIILQQTRVAQGMDYYTRFIEHFPDVKSLAEADEEEVLKCWQGLGYYSRARNLHFTARTIQEKYNGSFPKKHEEIRSLKGIGDYTAAAICSFAYNLPYAAVDGNFYRVLARIFEIETPIDTTQGKREFLALSQEIIDKQRPALFNQAVMDLGATICTPNNPQCNTCPIKEKCLALAHKRTETLPIKSKKTESRNRYFYYFLIEQEETIYLHKRTENDIWKGLYELPLIETPSPLMIDDLKTPLQFQANDFQIHHINKIHPTIIHILSHQRIHATLIEASAMVTSSPQNKLKQIHKTELDKYPISRLTEILLAKAIK